MTDTRKYQAFYNGKECTVEATSSYNAQTAAFNVFSGMFPRKKIKAYQITVMLADVTHSTASL